MAQASTTVNARAVQMDSGVVAVSGGSYSGEYIAFALPDAGQ